MTRAIALVALGTAVFGCAGADHIPYVMSPVPGVLPPSKLQSCGNETQADNLLIVFTSTFCEPCHKLLNDLAAHGAELEQRELSVLQVVNNVARCPHAKQESARHGGFSAAVGTAASVAQWRVPGTPTTFLLASGRIVGVLVGRVPVKTLLRFYDLQTTIGEAKISDA